MRGIANEKLNVVLTDQNDKKIQVNNRVNDGQELKINDENFDEMFKSIDKKWANRPQVQTMFYLRDIEFIYQCIGIRLSKEDFAQIEKPANPVHNNAELYLDQSHLYQGRSVDAFDDEQVGPSISGSHSRILVDPDESEDEPKESDASNVVEFDVNGYEERDYV